MDDFVPGSKKWEVLRYFDSAYQALVLQCSGWVYDHAQIINMRVSQAIWSTRGKCDIQKTADRLVRTYGDDSLELTIRAQDKFRWEETDREKIIYSII